MKCLNAIRNYELRQTSQIARALVDRPTSRLNWRIIVFPLFIYDFIRYRRRLQVLRKNLFFTRKFAIAAADEIHQGRERVWEIRKIETQTREVLDKEKKGYYTDKIRIRQLREIEFLIDHYLELLGTNQSGYNEAIKATYTARGTYLSFLNRLQKVEEEVIQSAIATMRRGTKKERRLWFDKVRAATRKIRVEAADGIYDK